MSMNFSGFDKEFFMDLHKIAQDIDDMFYEYECAGKCKFSFEVIDKVIENVKTTALRRFKGQ